MAKYSGSDVVEMAIEIEKNGVDFYTLLADKAKEESIKRIYVGLADAERDHIKAFQDLLGGVQAYEPDEAFTEEYFNYMNALAGEYVFTKKGIGASEAVKAKTDMEAIDISIDFEKKSIIFFEGIKRIVPSSDYNLVEALVDQEKDHIRQLMELKKRSGN